MLSNVARNMSKYFIRYNDLGVSKYAQASSLKTFVSKIMSSKIPYRNYCIDQPEEYVDYENYELKWGYYSI